MTERQTEHLQSLTKALTKLCDASDALSDSSFGIDGDEGTAVEQATAIARRVIVGEVYEMAVDAVRAEWAAASGGPIEDGDFPDDEITRGRDAS